MTRFAGAYADIQEAERRAKNPKWYQSFSGSLEERAAQAFAAKKKAEELNKQLCDMIRFVHGPTGLAEYKDILRDMRKQKEKREWKAQKRKEAALEWVVGLVAFSIAAAIIAGVIFLIGQEQGRW